MYDVYICFFFKQKTAYEMRISDWSSDVCSSDLKISIQPVRRIIANLSLRPGLTCSRTWGSTHHSQKNSGAARASELKLHFATSPPSANSGRPPKFRSHPKNPCLPSSPLNSRHDSILAFLDRKSTRQHSSN